MEEERPKERKLSQEELQQLFYLNNLKRSSDFSMIDRGSPRMYAALAALGHAKAVNDGYQITEAGRAHLLKYDRLLKRI
jgi:hypothetical protein